MFKEIREKIDQNMKHLIDISNNEFIYYEKRTKNSDWKVRIYVGDNKSFYGNGSSKNIAKENLELYIKTLYVEYTNSGSNLPFSIYLESL